MAYSICCNCDVTVEKPWQWNISCLIHRTIPKVDQNPKEDGKSVATQSQTVIRRLILAHHSGQGDGGTVYSRCAFSSAE